MQRQGLCLTPNKPQSKDDLQALIEQLGFVQIDSIRVVERAHHMILFARNHQYQRQHLRQLQEQDRRLFEHWTHDASIIPTAFYPHWLRRFELAGQRLRERERAPIKIAKGETIDFEQLQAQVLHHVDTLGPTRSRDLKAKTEQHRDSSAGGWWDWHPSKTALESLWRIGELSVSHRDGFQKVYDLASRVIPQAQLRKKAQSEQAFVEWACRGALQRLGFASPLELAAYWESVKSPQAKQWCRQQTAKQLIEVAVEGADGSIQQAFASPQVISESLVEPPDRLRVLSPFDPLLRDRKRLLRLFGFDYRIEVFVPEAKRQYGYYVFPLLEADRLIGRIDMKADRDNKALKVKALWLEPGIRLTKKRRQRLAAELNRQAKFVGLSKVDYAADFDRS
ncbi:MAG: hypothetical protein ACI9WS_000880 [Paraglaciecola psychrophila]|jgi:uncharacterized protein YcaQ